MPVTEPESTRERIARYRKLRGFTQEGLATRASISYSHERKIESGEKSPSASVIASLARALSVSVVDLVGQPYLQDLQADQLDGLIHPIREALDVYDLGADPEIAPRPLVELSAEATRMCALVRATDLRSVATELPGLIQEMTTAVHLAPSDRAWSELASLYRTAYDVATKLGFSDLSALALDRMDWAAQRGSDPIVAGIRQYLRALAYLRSGEYRTGRRLVVVGQQTIALADPGRVRDVVTGQLNLGAAVLAARAKDSEAAEAHLNEAQRYAESTGEAAQVHWLSFGPFNVAAHRVSSLIDQDQYAQALAVAKATPMPENWPASRAAHHWAEVARALMWTGRPEEATVRLQKVRQVAPQQGKYSVQVRQTVTDLLASRRTAPESVTQLASWVGINR
jgi:transcriptional regulator with XRE-family HTH domain